ncbi:hypothetical protein SacmaDRAFT_0577 [Saccharomonospora marina XMU15]|uniref:PPE family protein n=1 Tax=Saccharomonospora marina XMU15 TaxID=882083 RepID=H5X4D5_9PSEU|nr:hypothetical protein [Saccharomonospora marina]EHR48878.1 hypothetical protein SacmaDRAFT_0577 [Saccharomonospora marina XMU15]
MAEERPISASEIYESIVGGEGIGRLAEAIHAVARLRQFLESSAEQLGAIARQTHEGWQGGAGGLAANQAWLLGMVCGADNHDISRAVEAVTAQIDAFVAVHQSVVPVPPEPPPITADGLTAYLEGGLHYAADLASYRVAAENNVRAFAQYHEASVANGASIPTELAPLPVSTAEIERTDLPAVAPGRLVGAAEPTTGPVTEPAATGTATPSVPDMPPGTRPVSSPDTTEPAHGATASAAGDRPVSRHPSMATTVTANPPSVEGSAAPPARHPARTGRGEDRGSPGKGKDGAVRRDHGLVGRTDGRGPASGRHGSGSPGGQARPPAGPAGQISTSGANRAGGGGVAGHRGVSGVPLGAAGRRQAEEEREHNRPAYLREPDPDETFAGPHERTAPPVLGERPER